jgi:diguanylate cyclase (GGDEF)-like protein
VVAAIAFVMGAAAWFAPWDRWPRAATLILAPPVLGLMASSILLGSYDRSTQALYYLAFFVWIGVSQRRGIALALAPLVAAAYLIPMVATGRGADAFTAVWEIIGLGVLLGEGLAWMATRLRRAEALDTSRVWEMQMLLQAAERLARESDPAHAPDLIAVLGQQILRADATALFLLEDRDTLVGVAGSQWPSPVDDLIIRIDDDERIAQSLRSGELSVFVVGGLLASIGPPGAFHTEVLLPLRGSSAIEGLVAAGYAHGEPRLDAFSEHEARTFATQSALALERLQAVRSLQEDSLRDELTGLGNRRAANRMISALKPSDAVVMIDLDNFKDLNDTKGHAAGDELLREFAGSVTASLRDGDVALRLGGDEFLLILRAAGDHATAAVERLAGRWRDTASGITFSAGIAVCGEREEDLVERADAALYTAKRDGRDRIALSDETLDDLHATPA